MYLRPTSPALKSVLFAILLAIGLVAPAMAQSEGKDVDPARKSHAATDARTLAVHHGPTTAALTDETSDGHQLGDLRVASVPTTNAQGESLGRLDATLTTVGIDGSTEGDEVRISVLVFSFGQDGSDQVVVQGSAFYPPAGSTIATGAATTRPIVGGSGRFAGVSGSAVTQHLDDDTWVHWLKFDRNVRAGLKLRKAARKAVRTERQAERKAVQAERKAKRRADQDARKAQRDARKARVAREKGIKRTDLGLAEPGSALGQELGLWQYSIPAGSELDPHTHPGTQVARIARGELEYTVIAGEGELIRADGSREPIGPGTYTVGAGDSVVENPELEHFGANRTRRPVIIVAATLYPEGAPLSTPIEMADAEMAEQPEASPAG